MLPIYPEPTPAEEAAWQVLRPFIDPIDCNQFVSYMAEDDLVAEVLAMNPNSVLNDLLNHEPVKLRYLGKKQFFLHCRGKARFYYRSRWNGTAYTGYGGHRNAWKQLPFDAAAFALDARKAVREDIGVVLLGFDVDCHDGERDVDRTTGLILDLFPSAYHEPSTNGLGRHIYVKVYYPVNHRGSRHATLQHLKRLADRLWRFIESLRIGRGYDAVLDKIRGLPTLVEFRTDAQGLVVNHNVTLEDGSIVSHPSLQVVCRNQVIKVPFYDNCSIETVSAFFNAAYFSVQHLEAILSDDVTEGRDLNPDVAVQPVTDKVASVEIPSEDGRMASDGFPSLSTSLNNHNSVYPSRHPDVDLAVSDLAAVQDSHERRVGFAMLLARRYGRVPLPDELEAEYARAGLKKADSKSDGLPQRYVEICRWLEASFDPAKSEFSYRSYAAVKTDVEAILAARTTGRKLEWRKDGIKPVSIEKLATLYWAMKHSQGQASMTHFSYRQAHEALRQSVGLSAHRNEVAAMLRILEDLALIRRAGGYFPGKYGQGWKVS